MKKQNRYISSIQLLTLLFCGVGSGGKLYAKPELSTISENSLKGFYTGYHLPSKQYLNRICFVPDYALEKGKLKTAYIAPLLEKKLAPVGSPDAEGRSSLAIDGNVIEGLFFNDNASGHTYFKRDASGSDILNNLAGGVDVNMEFSGGGKVEGSVDIAMKSSKTDRSTTMTFISELNANSITVHPADGAVNWLLTPYGEVVKSQIDRAIMNHDEIISYLQQNCGTHYVSQANYGAKFFANMKVAGLLESDVDIIKGELELNLESFDGGGKVCLTNKKVAEDINIEMRMYQFGGDPVQFAGLLSSQYNTLDGANLETGNPNAGNPTPAARTIADAPAAPVVDDKPAPIPTEPAPEPGATTKNWYQCTEQFNTCIKEHYKDVGKPIDPNRPDGPKKTFDPGSCNAQLTQCTGEAAASSEILTTLSICGGFQSSCKGVANSAANLSDINADSFYQTCQNTYANTCRPYAKEFIESDIDLNKIKAECEGGEVATIIPDISNHDGSMLEGLISCNVNSIHKCYQVFKKIMRYATGSKHAQLIFRASEDEAKSGKTIEWEKVGSPNSPYQWENVWANQLDIATNKGFNITGYNVRQITENLFCDAFGNVACKVERTWASPKSDTKKAQDIPVSEILKEVSSCEDLGDQCRMFADVEKQNICTSITEECKSRTEQFCETSRDSCVDAASEDTNIIKECDLEFESCPIRNEKELANIIASENSYMRIGDPKGIQKIPSAVLEALSALTAEIESLFNVLSYVNNVAAVVPRFNDRLLVEEIESDVRKRMITIQGLFDTCRREDAAKCSESVIGYFEKLPTLPKKHIYVDNAEQVVMNSIISSGSFHNYCSATAAANFRAAPYSRWRLMMRLLIDSHNISDTQIPELIFDPTEQNKYRVGLDEDGKFTKPGRSVLDWRVPDFAIAGPRTGGTELIYKQYEENIAKIAETFCFTLAAEMSFRPNLTLNAINGGTKNITPKAITLEPLFFHDKLTSLTMNIGNLNIPGTKGFTQLRDLEYLNLANLTDEDPTYLRTMPNLNELTLVNPRIGDSKYGMKELFSSIVHNKRNNKINILFEPESTTKTYQETIDLKHYVNEFKKLRRGSSMEQFAIANRVVSNEGLKVKGVPEFFGLKEEKSEGSSAPDKCVSVDPVFNIGKWVGTFNGRLNLSTPLDSNNSSDYDGALTGLGFSLAFSPCCRKIKKRCQQAKQIFPGAANYKCGNESQCKSLTGI